MFAESTIDCPKCHASKVEAMPTDACRSFYECTGCGELLRPMVGDCSVFCSCGSVPAGARRSRNNDPPRVRLK